MLVTDLVWAEVKKKSFLKGCCKDGNKSTSLKKDGKIQDIRYSKLSKRT